MERYSGLPFEGRYRVLLSPFQARGNAVNTIVMADDGSYDIISVVGPKGAGPRALNFLTDESAVTLWHELGHGILDTLADLHGSEITSSAGAQDKLPWNCYGVWQQCVKEHMVRAVMIRLMAARDGEAAASRHLREEGEKKYPYLAALLERLKEYESSRARYPTLAHFYPRLLSVFPKIPAKPGAAAEEGPEAGPEWVLDASAPFVTGGQRVRALRYLDLVLAGEPVSPLRVKKAALLFLQKRPQEALQEATTFLAGRAPDAAALLVRARAWQDLGREADGAADLSSALKACAVQGSPVDVCRNVAERAGKKGAAKPTGLKARGLPANVSFEVAPGLELLSALLMLRDPQAFRARWSNGSLPGYAQELLDAFAPQASAAAVVRLDRLLKGGRSPMALSELFLSGGAEGAWKTDSPELMALSGEVADFARRSRFPEFLAAHQLYYLGLVAQAEAETEGTLRPEAVAAYMKTRFDKRCCLLLTPLLPPEFGFNLSRPEGEIRSRSDFNLRGGKLVFSFDDFASSVAHELVHTVSDPLLLAQREELESYAGLAPPGCTDSWSGCVLEEVDLVVTLRVLLKEEGESAYRATLERYEAAGFPHLKALCARLEEYEALARYASFASSSASDRGVPEALVGASAVKRRRRPLTARRGRGRRASRRLDGPRGDRFRDGPAGRALVHPAHGPRERRRRRSGL